jgi:hypothetical protein
MPPRIIKQRSVAAGALFSFSVGTAFFTMIYYIPIWFQAIQGVSATNSGIRNLPMILSVVLLTILSGIGTTALGYYHPFMITSSIMTTVGAGLLSTFTVDTGSPTWIGYQVLFGIGVGNGIQISIITVQTVLINRMLMLGPIALGAETDSHDARRVQTVSAAAKVLLHSQL